MASWWGSFTTPSNLFFWLSVEGSTICPRGSKLETPNPDKSSRTWRAFLEAGCLINGLQSVLNAAARLVCDTRKHDHVTHLLRDRHWATGCEFLNASSSDWPRPQSKEWVTQSDPWPKWPIELLTHDPWPTHTFKLLHNCTCKQTPHTGTCKFRVF